VDSSKDRGELTTVMSKRTGLDPNRVQLTNRLIRGWKGLPMPGRVLPTSLLSEYNLFDY
jgi:hypothetical protein